MIQETVHSIGTFLAGDIAMTLYWCAAIGGTIFFLISLIFSSFEISGVDSPDTAPDGITAPAQRYLELREAILNS